MTEIIKVDLRDENALYAAYMSFIQGGGLYVRTELELALGESVTLDVLLQDSPDTTQLTGPIIWHLPKGMFGGKQAGIGVQFPESDAMQTFAARIERILGGKISSQRRTDTM